MTDQEIREYYDSHPNLLLSDFAKRLGISVQQLKRILQHED